jgi:succinate-acetate transporter protein
MSTIQENIENTRKVLLGIAAFLGGISALIAVLAMFKTPQEEQP